MTDSTWADRVAAATRLSSPRQVGPVPLLYPLLEAMQVRETINDLRWTKSDVDFGRLVEILILNRIMAPQPLSHVGEWAGQTVVASMFGLKPEQLYDQRFGRGLDELRDFLGRAWVAIAAGVVQREGIDLSALHWDTTTILLEGEYEDSELAAYGRSSDNRYDHKLVKVGMDVTSQERIPLLYRLLNGSTADITTSVPNLEAVFAFLRRPECATLSIRPVVVGDCKMITPAAVATAYQHHLYYLGPWETDNVVQAVLRSVSQSELEDHELSYRPKRRSPAGQPFVPYRGVWRPFPVSYKGQVYEDRGLVVWSAGKQRLDEDKRKSHLKALLNRLAEIRGYLNKGKYIRRDYAAHQLALAQRGNPAKGLVVVDLTGVDRQLALAFHVNREALAEAQALDGKYLLGTNAHHLSADEALGYFKAQDGVEKQNRTLKGPLSVQPVYLHNDARIEGLVFVTFLALLLRAVLALRCRQTGLTVSVNQVLRGFASLYATDQTFIDGSRLTQLGELSGFQQQVLDGLGFPSATRYLQPILG